MADIARSELILGGQRSGKSRRAELLAREWLKAAPDHRAVMVATAKAIRKGAQAAPPTSPATVPVRA